MQISLNQILEMPNAAILAERIQSALEREKTERKHFYEIIDENKKKWNLSTARLFFNHLPN